MFILRFAVTALTAAALFFSACDGGDDSTEREKALALAAAQNGDDPNIIPPDGVNYDCTINVARQPAAPQSPLRAVAGKCLWNMEPQGGSWLITFRETWLCSDWSAVAAGFPPCEGLTGFHEWEYLVNVPSGTVDVLGDRGQFAPDM